MTFEEEANEKTKGDLSIKKKLQMDRS